MVKKLYSGVRGGIFKTFKTHTDKERRHGVVDSVLAYKHKKPRSKAILEILNKNKY